MSLASRVHEALFTAYVEDPYAWTSGEQIAASCNVTRAAINGAVGQLRSSGVRIEATRSLGYRLIDPDDIITMHDLERAWTNRFDPTAPIILKQSTGSTNDDAKLLAAQGAPSGTLVVASEQTGGRGRRGRPFFSLGKGGAYFSILLRPEWTIDQATEMTAAAAVSVCKSIDRLFGVSSVIKWVNDVYVGTRKVCGILSEGAASIEENALEYLICGIGVNVYSPAGGFPDEIRERAGYLSESQVPGLKSRIIGSALNHLVGCCSSQSPMGFMSEYQQRSMLDDKRIIISGGQFDGLSGTAIRVLEDLSLQVDIDGLGQANLRSGDVSIAVT